MVRTKAQGELARVTLVPGDELSVPGWGEDQAWGTGWLAKMRSRTQVCFLTHSEGAERMEGRVT